MSTGNAKPGRDLPSLDLLKGFEAAARTLSFTKAAAELFVTQSAISRQVKALEQQLEVELFRRRHRALLLTEAGQILFKTAGEVLRLLRDTTRRLGARSSRMLTVTTTVSFAALWLVPRLNDFRRLHPEIDVRLAAANDVYDLEREGIDLAVRYCTPRMVGRGALRLFGERVFPVCARETIGGRQLRSPQDLSKYVLLHFDDPDRLYPWLNWEVWFELTRTENVRPAGSLRFSHYEQIVQAALEGQGIALGRSQLTARWLKQGKLVLPFGKRYMFSLADARAYYIVMPEQSQSHADAVEFSRWLQLQARAGDADNAA